MYRLFVALRLPPSVRAALLAIMHDVPGARWQPEERLHLTLAFIGEVDGNLAEDVAASLTDVTEPMPRIALHGLGNFSGKGRIRSLWIGCAPNHALSMLRSRVVRALARAGVEIRERGFQPHVTLARFGSNAGAIQPILTRHVGVTVEPFEASAFFLYESVLSRDGPTYSVVSRYELRGSD